MFTCLCGAEWSGSHRVHCPACHETFDGPALADRHRPADECQRPALAGLVLVGGVWHESTAVHWQIDDTDQ